MKTSKKYVALISTALIIVSLFALSGCGSSTKSDSSSTSGSINVVSREDGSGTRGAFIELFGIEQKDSSGEKVDMTVSSAAITNSTSVMMTTVSGDPSALGYISLGSLNDTVKAVTVDGVEASAATVKDGTYTPARPFNVATKEGLSDVAQDFMTYIMSKEGQQIVEDNGYIAVDDSATAYTATGKTGKVTVAGSSSVTPVMEKLAEGYKAINAGVTIEVNQSDSTTGMESVASGICDIGMASRELKDSETSKGLTPTVIAKDGIAVIVNKDSSISNLTTDQVKAIYTGEVTTWEEIGA